MTHEDYWNQTSPYWHAQEWDVRWPTTGEFAVVPGRPTPAAQRVLDNERQRSGNYRSGREWTP